MNSKKVLEFYKVVQYMLMNLKSSRIWKIKLKIWKRFTIYESSQIDFFMNYNNIFEFEKKFTNSKDIHECYKSSWIQKTFMVLEK